MSSTNSKAKSAAAGAKPITVEARENETEPQTMARVMVGPYWRHGFVAQALSDKAVGKLPGEPKFDAYALAIKDKADQACKGDITLASEMLVSQAHSLDAMFTEMARRAAVNMGEYVNAMEIYARLALKAQSNCRATLEALMKLHQPREQTVKHVHVNEGGQAVVADNFHQHGGHGELGKSVKQSDATGAVGECAALPCPDPEGHGVPISSRKRKTALPDARGDESGCT